MYASTVGGGAMTLVFRPKPANKNGKVTSVKVPLKAKQLKKKRKTGS